MKKPNTRYTFLELKTALDMVEAGASFSEAADETGLNKSIVAREMRKRKNQKTGAHIEEYRKTLLRQNDMKNFE